MQKWIVCAGLMLSVTGTFAQTNNYKERAAAYVEKHKMYAMAEQQRTGVPAAITLGQGILETEAGNSELATEANNHFGIKCKSTWKGETFAHTDDAPNECFRKYGSTYESYKDHSDFLKQPRYNPLFRLPVTDYEGWAKGLKKFGYATNPRYAQQLIKIIEDFKLQDYTFAANNKDIIYPEIVPDVDSKPKTGIAQADKTPVKDSKPVAANTKTDKKPVVPAAVPAPTTAVVTTKMQTVAEAAEAKEEDVILGEPGKLVRINGLRAIYGLRGDVLLTYAIKYNIRYERLLEVNELPDAPLKHNMYVFLDKKKTRGSKPSHTVGKGETMQQIAQAEGIQIAALRELNRMEEDEEPMAGEELSLQRQSSEKPKLVAKVTELPPANDKNGKTAKKPSYIEKKELEKNKKEAEEKIAAQKAKEEEEARAAAEKAQQEEEAKLAAVKAEEERLAAAKAEEEQKAAALKAEEEAKALALKEEEEAKAAAALKEQQEEEERKIAIRTKAEKEAEEARLKAEEERKARQENRVVIKEGEANDEFSKLKSQLDRVVYANEDIEKQKAKEAEEKMISDKIAAEEKKLAEEKKAAEASKYYIVKKGDTAASIAKKNKLTMRQLMEWNNMDWAEVTPGQKLMVKQ